MRILVVSNLYPPDVIGGYELSCRQVVDGLRDRGHDVLVLTAVPQVPADDEPHIRRRLRRPDVFTTARTSSRSQFWEVEANLLDSGNVFTLMETLDEFQPDVVHLWNLVGLGGAALVGALEYLGIPWLWHLGDAVPAQLCGFGGRILPIGQLMSERLSGRFMPVSQGLINEIEHVVSLGGRTRLIPNWTIDVRELTDREYCSGSVLKIAFAGQLVEQKGVYIALDAVALLRDEGYRQLTLDIYGRGETEMVLHRIFELDLEDMVTLHGWTAPKDLRHQLREHDLFIFPTWAREPFAIAPLEAAAEGCVPLLSTPSGPAEWLVEDVHCLKARRNPEAFAATMRRVLDGEIDLAAMGRRGSYLVRTQFSLEQVLPVIEEELHTMAAQRRDPLGTGADLFRITVIAEAMIRRAVTEAA
jgi:glycosyltransferase involved in cell wall biosynthesis